VLAAIGADAGRVVPVDALVARVWGADPPPQARRTLHTHIARLRRLLQPVTLGRRDGGYVLEMEPQQVDLRRFRSLADRARDSALPVSDRLTLLREALTLWRGEPLAGLPGEWADRVREGCRSQRLDVVMAWAAAERRMGRSDATIPTLIEVNADHPLVEPVAAALMSALCDAERTAEALECYARIRERLRDELGADPGADLRSLYQEILRGGTQPRRAKPAGHDTAPAAGTAPTPAPSAVAAVAVPAQLPRDLASFAGRDRELARLDALLAAAPETPTAAVIAVITGTAGVGKTTLAAHWAHRVAGRFPDGQLYVNLRGFDPSGAPTATADAIRRFLEALGVPTDQIPADLDAQAALLRTRLAHKRILLFLDNARDAEQVRPLLPGSPTIFVLVTSRNQLTSLVATEGAHSLRVDVLRRNASRDLLAKRLGADRVAGDSAAVEEIVSICAGLPLALSIVAARAQQTEFPLVAIAAEIEASAPRIDALDGGDAASRLRAVFSCSYAALTPAAARLFRLLGLAVGPDIATPVAASLAGSSQAEARRLLAELARANMVAEPAAGRFVLHDLLREYAEDLTHAVDPEPVRRAAVTRFLDHLLHTACSADRWLRPSRSALPLAVTPPSAGVTPQRFANHRAAVTWYDTEHPVLMAALRHTAEAGMHAYTWRLAWVLETFHIWRRYASDRAAAWQRALAAATSLGDLPAQAYAHRCCGHAQTGLHQHAAALVHLRRALELYAEVGDPTGQAHTYRNLAHLSASQERFTEALDHSDRALTLYRMAGDDRGQADTLNSAGWYRAQLSQYAEAIVQCGQALRLYQTLGDLDGEAASQDSLGFAHHHLGQFDRAADCYRHALALFRQIGYRHFEAESLDHLGDTLHAAGDAEAARATWMEAVAILDELGHANAQRVHDKLAELEHPPHHRMTPTVITQ
jgi:DNA-binding SARP family transcriptional activator/tetratricopeptide (TPR) repeat protein